jgi:hypothetical protein
VCLHGCVTSTQRWALTLHRACLPKKSMSPSAFCVQFIPLSFLAHLASIPATVATLWSCLEDETGMPRRGGRRSVHRAEVQPCEGSGDGLTLRRPPCSGEEGAGIFTRSSGPARSWTPMIQGYAPGVRAEAKRDDSRHPCATSSRCHRRSHRRLRPSPSTPPFLRVSTTGDRVQAISR